MGSGLHFFILIFTFISTTIISYGQTNKNLLDHKFYSTFQKFLDNANGIKIDKEHKILFQQLTADTIRLTIKYEDNVTIAEFFDINWDIDNKNTYFLTNVEDENKELVRFELGFSFEYSKHYYFVSGVSKGELRKTKARITFYILRKDLDEFKAFVGNYKIRHDYY